MVAPLCRNLLNMERSHKPYGVSHDSWNWSGVNEINTALERREVQEKKEKNKDKDKNKNKNKTKGRKKKKKEILLTALPEEGHEFGHWGGCPLTQHSGEKIPLSCPSFERRGDEIIGLN